jgi:hypothetical protein
MLNVGAGAMLLLTERLPRSWPSCYGQKLSPGFNGRGLFKMTSRSGIVQPHTAAWQPALPKSSSARPVDHAA